MSNAVAITVDADNRTFFQDVFPSLRDTVEISFSGCAQYLAEVEGETYAEGLTLAFTKRGADNASVIPAVTRWTIPEEGDTAAVVTVELDSVTLRALFEGAGDSAMRTMTLVLKTSTLTICKGPFSVQNSPYVDDGGETGELPTPVATRLAALEDAITALTVAMGAHIHDANGTAKVAHTNLTGIGTLTHAELDAALDGSAASINGRVTTAVADHDATSGAHGGLFSALGATVNNHVASDASAGNNVHGVNASIDAKVATHNDNGAAHADIRGAITDLEQAALLKAAFASVSALTTSSTLSLVRAKVNELLLILKGGS